MINPTQGTIADRSCFGVFRSRIRKGRRLGTYNTYCRFETTWSLLVIYFAALNSHMTIITLICTPAYNMFVKMLLTVGTSQFPLYIFSSETEQFTILHSWIILNIQLLHKIFKGNKFGHHATCQRLVLQSYHIRE
jgi:hypothetical protein